MKYLVIAALFALFLLLLYSKIYPYVQALKRVFSVAKNITNAPQDDACGFQRAKLQEKLVRCVGCAVPGYPLIALLETSLAPRSTVLGNVSRSRPSKREKLRADTHS